MAKIEAEAEGVIVGGADRHDGELHIGIADAHQAVEDFMGGAVSAGGRDDGESRAGRLLRQLDGVSRMQGRTKLDVRAPGLANLAPGGAGRGACRRPG